MKSTLETKLGVFVALSAIVAFIILETIGSFEILRPGYYLHAYFESARELTEGAPVKMAGVTIGRVEKIQFEGNKIKVTMKIRPGINIKTDSKASIRFTGLMGQNYVHIDFGSLEAPNLEPNSVIPTIEQPDFNTIMSKLDNAVSGIENLTKSFTGEKIDNLLGPLVDFFKQNQAPLHASLVNISNITRQIAEGQGTVGLLVSDPSLYHSALNIVSNLGSIGEDIKLTLTEVRLAITNVTTGQGTIGKLFNDDTLYKEATESATTLKEILQKINQGVGTAGRLVNDPSLYNNAKLTLQKLDQATESLEDQGPLSVIGIAVGRIF